MRLIIFFICSLFPVSVAAFFYTWYDLEFAPVSFLETAPWIISNEGIALPLSVEDCWDIITDDDAWEFWFPEVQYITNSDDFSFPTRARRQIQFNICPTNWILCLLLFGDVTIDEMFDVWEPNGDNRRYSFYFSGAGRPPIIGFEQAREDYRCDAVTNTTSTFTYTVALNPGLVPWLLGFIVLPGLQQVFVDFNTKRLEESIANGDLPRPP